MVAVVKYKRIPFLCHASTDTLRLATSTETVAKAPGLVLGSGRVLEVLRRTFIRAMTKAAPILPGLLLGGSRV